MVKKKIKPLSPEWRRYRRAVREIQALIDAHHRPWWKRLAESVVKVVR